MNRSEKFSQVANWFNAYVVKAYPENERLQELWMKPEDPMAACAGWSLTADPVAKRPGGLELNVLLERIETEMANAAPETQWTMNMALAQIGTCFPALHEKAIAIGEQLGIYRNYPIFKGC
ncbi:MAG: hypothetical protein Q7V19_09695, partial [Bacteroidales bacterium]|nr:hypothetical protein [Bacteroidales bacterium]